jgi:hypothetical protein
MGVSTKTLHNHTVYYDTDNIMRWIDVFGPKATKWIMESVRYTADNYTVTAVNGSTIAQVAGAFADSTENDGVQMQLLGEAFYLSGQYPAYFGCRFQGDDVDQTDLLVGLAIQDTTAIVAVSDGAYFRSVDESAVLNFVLEKDTVETSNAASTLTDSTWTVAEFYYDGVTNITAYIDGVQVAQVALTDANMPDDEYLSPILAMLTGEGVTNSITVAWARAFQIRE